MPIAKSDLAVRPPAVDPDRTALLLPTVEAIRKRVVGADVIKLGGRLVIPRAPACAAVHGDDGALIARQENNLRVVRRDPDVLIIVASGRAAPAIPRLAAVGRFPANDTRSVNDVGIFRIDPQHR